MIGIRKATRGFTIVELLIVIVVIAILAAISIVAYNGIQSRANNSKIASAANQIERAIVLFNTQTGLQPFSGGSSTGVMPSPPTGEACPGSSGAGGWAASGSGYNCGLEDLLVSYKMLPQGFFAALPGNKLTNGSYRQTVMFYGCSNVANGYILMWFVDNPSVENNNSFDAAWRKCSNNPSASASSTVYYTNYGMRNGKFIQL